MLFHAPPFPKTLAVLADLSNQICPVIGLSGAFGDAKFSSRFTRFVCRISPYFVALPVSARDVEVLSIEPCVRGIGVTVVSA
jgi:hypothetical protein